MWMCGKEKMERRRDDAEVVTHIMIFISIPLFSFPKLHM